MKLKILAILIVSFLFLTGCGTNSINAEDLEKINTYISNHSLDSWNYAEDLVLIEKENDKIITTIVLKNVNDWTFCYDLTKNFTEKLLDGNIEEIEIIDTLKYACDNSYIVLEDFNTFDIEDFDNVKVLDEEENLIEDAYSIAKEDFKEEYLFKTLKYYYDEMIDYSDEYYGEYAYLKGEVIQVIEETEYMQYRVNITQGTDGSYEDTIMAYIDDVNLDEEIVVGDVINIYGELDGIWTLDSGTILPCIYARYIDLEY